MRMDEQEKVEEAAEYDTVLLPNGVALRDATASDLYAAGVFLDRENTMSATLATALNRLAANMTDPTAGADVRAAVAYRAHVRSAYSASERAYLRQSEQKKS
jgi:hypothetical protein